MCEVVFSRFPDQILEHTWTAAMFCLKGQSQILEPCFFCKLKVQKCSVPVLLQW